MLRLFSFPGNALIKMDKKRRSMLRLYG